MMDSTKPPDDATVHEPHGDAAQDGEPHVRDTDDPQRGSVRAAKPPERPESEVAGHGEEESVNDGDTGDPSAGDIKRYLLRPGEKPPISAFRKDPKKAMAEMEENLRGGPTTTLKELKDRNPTAQELLDEREAVNTLSQAFNTFSDEQKEYVRQIPPKNMVKDMAETEHVDREEAENFLRLIYPDKQEEEIDALLGEFDSLRSRIQPAPAEEDNFGTREDGSDITADELLTEKKEELEALADEGRNIMSMPEGNTEEQAAKEDAIEGWKTSLAGIFGDNAKNVMGKAIKYTTIGTGILMILFLFIFSWHTKTDGR